MTEFFRKLTVKIFGAHLEFRVRLFNIVATASVMISSFMGVVGFFSKAGIVDTILCFSSTVSAATLLWYSTVSGKFQLCVTITVVLVFFIFFPILFFATGGYHSGMPSFLILALVFTVYMLEGKKKIILFIAELILYAFIFILAHYHPRYVSFFETEKGMFIDMFVAFLVVSISLSVTMSLHLRLYIRQQRELEAARQQAEEYAKMKSDLFAAMSHEMRTPLTVMSTYAQYAVEQIKETGVNEQTLTDFNIISDEARRLAEMADGTLKILRWSNETDETGAPKSVPVNIGTLAERITGLLKPIAARKGRDLATDIKSNIPHINGDADALTQLLWNILQNAIIHSGGVSVALRADTSGDRVVITVKDDGNGIPPDLLPRVFEHGVSGTAGGSGIGLPVCREIARKHGGDVEIESEEGKGTRVTVSLPKAPKD
jgi:signal transduction histidine kinase